MPNFEVFDKRAVPLVKRPQVTLQKKGPMSMNASSYHALGEPEAVELLYDRDERIIGFRPCAPEQQNAYPIRRQSSGNVFLVSGTAFVNYYGIKTEVSRRYNAEMIDGGVLIVDLKSEGQDVVSNRTRGRATRLGGEVHRPQ